MTEQPKRFFEHWITQYGNRLDEVAMNKKAVVKLHEDSLKEMTLSTSPAIDFQAKPRTVSVAEPPAAIPFNRSNQ